MGHQHNLLFRDEFDGALDVRHIARSLFKSSDALALGQLVEN